MIIKMLIIKILVIIIYNGVTFVACTFDRFAMNSLLVPKVSTAGTGVYARLPLCDSLKALGRAREGEGAREVHRAVDREQGLARTSDFPHL